MYQGGVIQGFSTGSEEKGRGEREKDWRGGDQEWGSEQDHQVRISRGWCSRTAAFLWSPILLTFVDCILALIFSHPIVPSMSRSDSS